MTIVTSPTVTVTLRPTLTRHDRPWAARTVTVFGADVPSTKATRSPYPVDVPPVVPARTTPLFAELLAERTGLVECPTEAIADVLLAASTPTPAAGHPAPEPEPEPDDPAAGTAVADDATSPAPARPAPIRKPSRRGARR